VTLVKNCLKELGFSDTQFPPKGQLRKISEAKGQLHDPQSFAAGASGYFQTRTAELYSMYQKRLRDCNAMDFDDLLFNTVWLLKNNQTIGDSYRRRFKYLLVDEYQDTNHIQYLMLKLLLDEHNNLCVVGDEDQSIYGWRGADIRNILDFEKDYPGAKIIKLEQNYRSTSVILKAASAVIGNNQMRKGKTLWTATEGGDNIDLLLVDSAEDEASEVISIIDGRRGEVNLKDTVILYRTNAQSRPFEEQCRRRNLPYQIVGGVSFYQRKEIKDLVAYLKLITNPADDVSFGRVINYPKRGIGNITIAQISELARAAGVPLYEIAVNHELYPELAGKGKRIDPFIKLVEKYRSLRETDPVDLLTQDLVAELQLIEAVLADDPATGQTKVENIEAFIEGASEYARTNGEAHLENYLADISLFTDLDAYREVDDKITLMTLHAAKGLEYDTVFLVGLEEGLFPLQRTTVEPEQLEEERRLFYVGATRAHCKLFLSSASMRFRFGEVTSIPSRFIKEIPNDVIDTRDCRKARHYVPDEAMPLRSGAGRGSSTAVKGDIHYEYEGEEMLRVGSIVAHPTFGRGKIVGTEGFGESLRLEIMFAGIGLKRIMARFAKLTVVG
ncbi:MAG: UvrD-helicase domain-containing protein, partial [candidate division Zixibacteria bacterium]|nr:UvrD-helicase domain-containing protein [candidate division Zixibacteria bacterium]